jgi:hypothetical protein
MEEVGVEAMGTEMNDPITLVQKSIIIREMNGQITLVTMGREVDTQVHQGRIRKTSSETDGLVSFTIATSSKLTSKGSMVAMATSQIVHSIIEKLIA